jgi:ABC-type phosphate transport system auxiliary subunit
MGLSYDDLQAIRTIVEETVNPLRGDIEALSNDIKDIYEMIDDLQKAIGVNGSFEKLSIEKKILRLHAELVEAAKQAGVSLPSH